MQGWVSPVYSQILCLHALGILRAEPKDNNKVRKERCFPGAPSSPVSVAMCGSCTGLWANRRFLLTAWAGSIWLSKCVWFKGLSWYPASDFQQVPITVFHLPARVMGQMQSLCILNTCSCSISNVAKLGPEFPTSPRTHMLSWKYGGISALLGSRFASVNQSFFCCSSWEPSVAETQVVTVQKRRLLDTSVKEFGFPLIFGNTSRFLNANDWQ